MILYIAEKPSLGRAVADALPKPHKRREGFIEVGNGDAVSWCIGHLLEQAQPDAYNPDYKRWNISHLPIVPQEWKTVIKSNTRKQFTVLKKLVKQADLLVNIGDPDREGQLLVDEVINRCGVSRKKMLATKRCLISDLNTDAVKKSLANLKNNTDFVSLSTSALARSRADWLYGINMTRLCTVQGQKFGYKGVLSIGRVQTPVLGLVVKRDLDIESFVSKPFYELEVTLDTEDTFKFMGKWRPSVRHEADMDEENRILNRTVIEKVAASVVNQTGKITNYKDQIKNQEPPLAYNLSSLQIDAANRYGMSAKKVLETCQNLYERHKLITYPRSDCRYLPTEHSRDAKSVISAIAGTSPSLRELANLTDTKRKTRVWDDGKVTAHHAIIPTSNKMEVTRIATDEAKIYELIARQYLMQFLPTFDYRLVLLDTTINKECFTSRVREIIALGWKQAYTNSPEKKEFDAKSVTFPVLKKGDKLFCSNTKIIDKQTTAPKRFTDATLLAAMTGISRFVEDPDIRKILRETDGLGTEATRAGIIELLFARTFLERVGREIRSTKIGRQLIAGLPSSVSLPDMTAQWEAQLEMISSKELSYARFMNPMTDSLRQLISDLRTVQFEGLNGLGQDSKARKGKKRKSKAS